MFQSANYYYVEYTNINGLAGSSPVFANGYKVGTVRNINYNYAKPGHVTVEVEVDVYKRQVWSCKGTVVGAVCPDIGRTRIPDDCCRSFVYR